MASWSKKNGRDRKSERSSRHSVRTLINGAFAGLSVRLSSKVRLSRYWKASLPVASCFKSRDPRLGGKWQERAGCRAAMVCSMKAESERANGNGNGNGHELKLVKDATCTFCG